MTTHTILRLGHRGDGIAEGPVYAPLTLPGEVVEGRLAGDRLQDIRIVTPSSDRVRPPCRHFRGCGGCALQHGADGFVTDWKQDVLRHALSAQGIEADFAPPHVSPPGSRRRATLAARRGKAGAMAGFHARGTDTVVDIPDCQLLHPGLMAALPVARALAQLAGSRRGALAVAVTLSHGGLDIAVRGGKSADGPLRVALAQLANTHDLARLVWDDDLIVTRRSPGQDFGGVRVVPPPGAFLQATAAGEAALRDAVLAMADGADRVIDLFAGCGTFALPLAALAQVHAVEGDAAMLAALDHGWRHGAGLKTVTTQARDLFRTPVLAEELRRFDAAVIDPPRAGAAAQIAQLAQARVPVIAHVSCNPVTFARDAATLVAAGYAMGAVRVVDQFRWSTHLEMVAAFRLTRG